MSTQRCARHVRRATLGAAVASVAVIVVASAGPMGASAEPTRILAKPFVSNPVSAKKLEIDLRKAERLAPSGPEKAKELPLGKLAKQSSAGSTVQGPGARRIGASPRLRRAAATTPTEFSTAVPNFDGIGYQTVVPPDTTGAVGPDHFVQSVNSNTGGSQFAIYAKTGGPALAGPLSLAGLWTAAGAGNRCQVGRGDPIVVYDQYADRFVLSQFDVGPDGGFGGTDNSQCIAVARGPNPVTDGWALYEFPMAFGHDYPKLGVWPDGYYLSSQRGYPGGALNAIVFDRANMLNGNPATFQAFTAASPAVTFLPADADGTPPPAGTPNFFARMFDGALFGGADRVEIWAFTTDWGNPANSTFALLATLNTAPFSSDLCGGSSLNNTCVDQPGTAQRLDTLSVWPMFRLQYRNFGGHETLLFNHSVDPDNSDTAGVRWYELRRPTAGAWGIHQQGTFAPDAGAPGLADDPSRWMGSISMDKAGNIALGYSISSGTVSPGIAYTGRRAGDPLGLMPAGEFTLQAGQGSQIVNGNRWGDYSHMTVDPEDGCTFWFTSEYINNVSFGPGQGNTWATRIGAFRYPDCNTADLRVTKSDSPDPVTAGSQLRYTVTTTNDGPDTAFGVTTSDTLPAGVTYVSDDRTECVHAAGVVTCDWGDLPSGESRTVEIVVLVPASKAPGPIVNTATVTSDWEDPDPSNNTTSETTQVVASADLRVTKICKPDGPVQAGQQAFCDIFVDNLGPSDATGVTLTDTFASSGPFTIVSAVPSQGSCVIASPVVTCNLGTIPAGGRATVRVTVSSAEAGDINDVASVTSTTPDPDLSNNQAEGRVSVSGAADLGLVKVDSPDPLVAADRQITYTLTVTNNGPSTAQNVRVRDVVGAGQEIVSVSAPTGSCVIGVPGNAFLPTVCTFDSMAPSTQKVMTIVVRVPSGILSTAQNDARVSSDTFDPNNANDLASTQTTISIADVEILKTSDFDVYKPSSTVKYVVRVTNHGPASATGVVVTDNLPDVKQAIYLSDTGGCTKAGLVLTCNLGTIAATTFKEFNVYVRIKGNKGSVVNTASVATSSPDPGPAPNTSTRTILIKGGV